MTASGDSDCQCAVMDCQCRSDTSSKRAHTTLPIMPNWLGTTADQSDGVKLGEGDVMAAHHAERKTG